MIEFSTICFAALVSYLMGQSAHPSLNCIARFSVQALIFSALLGPFYLALKLMPPLAVTSVVGLPVVAALAARFDRSGWIVVDGVFWESKQWIKKSFIWIVLGTVSIYAVYQVYASFSMGQWPGSYWIFNVDNSQRLVHAWSIALSSSYPPEIIAAAPWGSAKGSHYHFGSPALGALFSTFLPLDPGTAYLRLVVPFLLLPAIIAPFFAIYGRTKNILIACLALALLTFPRLADLNFQLTDNFFELFNGLVHFLDYGEARYLRLALQNLFGGPEAYGNMVQNGATVSLTMGSALVMSFYAVLRRNTAGLFLLSLLPVLAMMNTRLLFSVFALVGVFFILAISAHYRRLGLAAILLAIVVLPAVSIFWVGKGIGLSGTEYTVVFQKIFQNPVPGSAIIATLILVTLCFWLNNISSIRNWTSARFDYRFPWVMLVICLSVVIGLAGGQPTLGQSGWPFYAQELGRYLNDSLVIWSFYIFSFSILYLQERPHVTESGTEKQNTTPNARRYYYNGILAIILALFSIKGVHLTAQLATILHWPEDVHEAADFSEHVECLYHVGSDATLATNNLAYPAQNYKRAQGYGTFLFLKGHKESSGILAGAELLSRPGVSMLDVINYFKQYGATHLFLVKHAPYPSYLNRYITFQNKTCAVVPLREIGYQ